MKYFQFFLFLVFAVSLSAQTTKTTYKVVKSGDRATLTEGNKLTYPDSSYVYTEQTRIFEPAESFEVYIADLENTAKQDSIMEVNIRERRRDQRIEIRRLRKAWNNAKNRN